MSLRFRAGAPELETLLVRRAESGGPIVVIVENLDQILGALGDEGQQQLRHVPQAHRPFLLIATSTRIDRALSDQARPFYGFFTTTRLEPFDISQAAAMLSAIAAENEDRRLVDYLRSDEGKTRLRTIAHLAGGQPRIWALLASALTVEGLGELVELLLKRVHSPGGVPPRDLRGHSRRVREAVESGVADAEPQTRRLRTAAPLDVGLGELDLIKIA